MTMRVRHRRAHADVTAGHDLSPRQATDSPQFIPVLRKVRVRGPVGRPLTRPDAVTGDIARLGPSLRVQGAVVATHPTR
ncbi:hypothetical protein STRTUCAR8_00054, partial [Streptomyces turgidiscabies Car8]